MSGSLSPSPEFRSGVRGQTGGNGSPGEISSGGRFLPVRSSRLRRHSLNGDPDRPLTLQDLQEFSRSMEHMIHSKNEMILTKLHELEARLQGISLRNSPCGLTQRQLDLYQWVDPTTGKCTARYVNPEGKELICGQLYTTHDPIVTTPVTSAEQNETSTTEITTGGAEETPVLLPAPAPPPPPEIISQAVKSEAAARIQRLASRRRAWKTAEAEREWKIFSDLDTQDEADMLNLAAFMQTLLNWVPNPDSPTKEPSPGTIDLTQRLTSECDDDEDDDKSAGGKVTLDHIHLSIGDKTFPNEDINNFLLPRGSVTPEMAKNIVTLYRRKGKLSHKSLQRILREVYTPLKKSPNISYITVGREEKITVVGDLHGQLGDLFHILDESGFPSITNKYLFNGDFVDRGVQGIEVIVVILSLYSAFPNCVFLNRGNHEDEAICRVYGFEKECREKYDDLIFGMFAEVFRHLPLASIINNSIFVVHGGLFHSDCVLLSDIEQIDRTDYIAKPPIPYPECTKEMNDEEVYQEFLKQLQRDILWSDPSPDELGITRNQRGAGVKFGIDVVEKFLSDNNLKMIIRSHECVRKGFDLPFANSSSSSPAKNLFATIFSASNYSGGHNDGAYLIFTTHRMTKSNPVEGNYSASPPPTADMSRTSITQPHMFYSVHKYKTSDAKKSLIEVNKMSLRELIIRKRKSLLQAFELADPASSGEVPKMTCVEIMQNITQLKIFWLSTIHNLVPSCVNGNSINYYDFINNFSLKSGGDDSSSPNSAVPTPTSGDEEKLLTIDSLYGQRSKLEAVFRFFDTNGDGMISREEFHRGCDIINMTLPSDQQLTNYDHVLNLMDFDHSDSIDLNEFFETFRILDAKDGVVDGVISLAPQPKK